MISEEELAGLVNRLHEVENDYALKCRFNRIFDIDCPEMNGQRQMGDTRWHFHEIDWAASFVERSGRVNIACVFFDGCCRKLHLIPSTCLNDGFDIDVYHAMVEFEREAARKERQDKIDEKERKEYERLKAKFEKGEQK